MARLPQVGDTFGRYRVDSQIGFGGMGVVFAATDLSIGRTVALKVVSAALGGSAEFLARFEREAALLARLDSPHVIGIYDYGQHDDCPYIATQYVGGGDLGHLISARGPMPPRLAVTVCAQVADALTDAHEAGVVHRDVKPSNVLLRDADTADLHAYLCDFGIARTADQGGLTMAGAVSGTWTYLAPECGAGAQATPASDVYSVGCLLWATLTGQPPYRGSDVEVAIAHQQAPVPQLEGTDPFSRQVNEVLQRSLAKKPADRYPDADSLRRDLLALAALPSPGGIRPRPMPARSLRAATPTPPGTPVPPAPLPQPPRRRRTGWIVAAACLGVLAATGGVVAATQLGGGDDPGPGGGDPEPTTSTEPGPTDPTEATPDGPVTGDRDGDGLGDLVVERTVADRLEVLSYTSTGRSFEGPERETLTGHRYDIEEFVDADVDGDDQPEHLRLTYRSNRDTPVQVTGELAAGGEVSSTFPRPPGDVLHTFEGGDADGDGRDDIVITTWQDDVPFTYYVARSTDAGFSAPQKWLSTRRTYRNSSTEVGDLDGDGRVDVAVVTTRSVPEFTWSSRVELFRSTGSRFVASGAAPAVETGPGPELLTADTDGDDDDEAVLVDLYSTPVAIKVIDHGARGLQRAQVAGLLSSGYVGLTTSDVDGDGREDVVQLFTPDSDRPARVRIEAALSKGRRYAQPRRWADFVNEQPDDHYLTPAGTSFP